MQLGFGLPVAGSWARPDICIAVAVEAERRGFRSLWAFQRLLSPVDGAGQEWLPPVYRRVLEPFTALSFVAGQTSSIRLGLAVANAPFTAPINLAAMASTVDVLSNGRFDLGLGSGWMPEEFAATGAQLERRGAQIEDTIAALETIWAGGLVAHEGEFSRVPSARVASVGIPGRRPGLLLGGSAPAALRRAGRLADGWVSSSNTDLLTIGSSIELIRSAAVDAGRDPDQLRFIVRGVVKVRSDERAPLTGTIEEIRADLRDLAGRGVTECFLDLNFDPLIGSIEADPDLSLERAMEVLDAFAPDGA